MAFAPTANNISLYLFQRENISIVLPDVYNNHIDTWFDQQYFIHIVASVLLVKETEGNNRVSLSETALQPYQLHLGTCVSRLTHNGFQE